jgi:hypothetical protein
MVGVSLNFAMDASTTAGLPVVDMSIDAVRTQSIMTLQRVLVIRASRLHSLTHSTALALASSLPYSTEKRISAL